MNPPKTRYAAKKPKIDEALVKVAIEKVGRLSLDKEGECTNHNLTLYGASVHI